MPRELLAGSFSQPPPGFTMATRQSRCTNNSNFTKIIDQVLSPDGDIETSGSSAAASQERGSDNPFIKMLKTMLDPLPDEAVLGLNSRAPRRSAMRNDRPLRVKGKARFHPDVWEPTAGTLRPTKQDWPKEVKSSRDDRFDFPAKWARRRAKKARACQQIAHNDVADLEQ